MPIARVARANTERPFPTDLLWMKRARCLRKGTHNFWPENPRPTPREYSAIMQEWCFQCPVRGECLVTVIRKETIAKHTSRGVEGGATPKQRATLRRRIREEKLCIAEGVWRWLNNKPISKQPIRNRKKFRVTITNPEGAVIYQNNGNSARGGHMIAARELRRRGGELVATVKDPGGHIVEVLTPSSLVR